MSCYCYGDTYCFFCDLPLIDMNRRCPMPGTDDSNISTTIPWLQDILVLNPCGTTTPIKSFDGLMDLWVSVDDFLKEIK